MKTWMVTLTTEARQRFVVSKTPTLVNDCWHFSDDEGTVLIVAASTVVMIERNDKIAPAKAA